MAFYIMGICMGFTAQSPPCGAHLYNLYDPDSAYRWTKEACLSKARKLETKDPATYKVYCIGKDGISLDSQGRAVDRMAYFAAIDRWHERPDRAKLPPQKFLEVRW